MGFAFIIIIAALLLGMWAQMRIGTAYGKWKQVSARSGITGAEAAQYIMRKAGISDVAITSTHGHLTDHYDPSKKRLVLSEENYHGRSLAALGVAAHEAGHAIQHKVGYSMLELRMSLVPVTTFASKLLPIVVFGGFFFHFTGLMWAGVFAYGVLTLFQLVTLPVEFDASRRARLELVNLGILEDRELVGVNETLNAAAWTYVAAFISSLGWLLYFLAAARR
jgi:uncharacterized protein